MVLRKRSEAAKKPSAEERTLPLPGTTVDQPHPKTPRVKCPGCEEKIKVTAIKAWRANKNGECPECGGEIPRSLIDAADPTVLDENGDDGLLSEKIKKNEERIKKDQNDALERALKKKYCGDCGAVFIGEKPSCDHDLTTMPVSDPSKAKHPPTRESEERKKKDEMKQKEEPKLPKNDRPSSEDPHPPTPSVVTNNMTVSYDGKYIRVEWNKSTFNMGMSANFAVGPFVASEECKPSERVQVADRLMDDLEQIATSAFKRQSKWYIRMLGLMPKD